MTNDQVARTQLVNLLIKQQAHMLFEDAVADFPEDHINVKPPNLTYTFWHLIEHIRICQRDDLDYIQNPEHVRPEFPVGFWPHPESKTDLAGWNKTVEQFHADRQALVDLIQDPATDLYAQIPHGKPGHSVLHEVLSIADHNAYHIGELGILRQSMELWPD